MRRRVPARIRALRLFRRIILWVLALFTVVFLVFGVLVYKVTHPSPAAELVTPAAFLLPSENLSWNSKDGIAFEGLWISGRKGAPAIVLAAGYGMNRSTALSLAAALHEKGFHTLLYEQRGSGAAPKGHSTLGLHETEDMMAALDLLQTRPEADPDRVGIWGVDIGARAALDAAARRAQVQVIAADSVFDSVEDFLNVIVRETTGFAFPLLKLGCREGFLLYQFESSGNLTQRLPLAALANKKILFIAGENRAELGRLTRSLYEETQPRQEIKLLATARARQMSGAEMAIYDRTVSDFFSRNLGRTSERTERGRPPAGDRPVEHGGLQQNSSGGKDW